MAYILLERKGADINPLETVLPRRDVLLRIRVVVKCQAEGTAQKHSTEERRHSKFCTALRIVLPEPDWEFVVFTRFNQIDNFFQCLGFPMEIVHIPQKKK